MRKSDCPYLRDILERIARIERCVAKGKEVFDGETIIQDAVIRSFEVIGEAVKHLSPSLKEKYDHVPWKDIAGMRDKVIHDYLGVDLPLIWNIATEELPALKRAIEQMLQTATPES